SRYKEELRNEGNIPDFLIDNCDTKKSALDNVLLSFDRSNRDEVNKVRRGYIDLTSNEETEEKEKNEEKDDLQYNHDQSTKSNRGYFRLRDSSIDIINHNDYNIDKIKDD